MVVLEDIIKEYVDKFGKEPVLPFGSEGEAIDLLIEAMETNKPLKFDYTDKDPNTYVL